MFSREILMDEQAPAIALLAVVIRQYGVESFNEQPEYLRQDLEQDFGVRVSDLQSDKIQAAITILMTDQFESQWEVFSTICSILNSTPDTFDSFTELFAEEAVCALAQYKLLVEDDKEDPTPFSDEIKAYLGVIFHNYGMSKAPELFPEAIMPEGPESDDTEKNIALNEVYSHRRKAIKDYLAKICH